MKHSIKNLAITLLAAALILTACGTQTTNYADTDTAEAGETAAAPTSADLYSALSESGYFGELVPLDSDYMLNFFGIDTSVFTDYAAGAAEDVMNADAIIILNTDNEVAAAEAAEKLETYKERKINELTGYNPGELPKTEAAEVRSKGTFTYILICDDNVKAEEILEGYIN